MEVSNFGKTVLVLELCDHSLYDMLNDHSNGLPSDDFFRTCMDISNGILFLYKKNIIHRDIKPDNVMVKKCKEHTVCKLGDFGNAKVLIHGQKYNSDCGTHEYMHPDIFAKMYHHELNMKTPNNNLGYEQQLWAVGITFYELATGHLPFEATREEVYKMYDMISKKPDDVIAITNDGTCVYSLPETCDIENKFGVTALLAGLLQSKDMWSMEQFEMEMKALVPQEIQGKEQKRDTAKKAANQKENRVPRKDRRQKLSVVIKRNRNRNRKTQTRKMIKMLSAKWNVTNNK